MRNVGTDKQVLGANKQILLDQVKNNPSIIDIQKLLELLNTYEDLKLDDFRGYVSDNLIAQLHEANRDPEELKNWKQIEDENRFADTIESLQYLQRIVTDYIRKYPDAPKIVDAQTLLDEISSRIEAKNKVREAEAARAREQKDWELLERGNYNALQSYKSKYPSSVHLDELDDLMWLNTKNVMNFHGLNRYLGDWPLGKHAHEANQALSELNEWEEVKRSDDLFLVDDYRDNHPSSPFINEVNGLFYRLRDELLVKMKENPSEYDKEFVLKLINADIFTKWQLEDEDLITEDSWRILTEVDRSLFPDIQLFFNEDPDIETEEGCTDVYLFGTPGTGKTCLLMGLTGANGQGYTLNMKVQGGPYAAALQEYVSAGLTPGSTFGNFVTSINGEVIEQTKRNNYIYHRINLIEMSGEEFALRIADNKEVSLSNMGTGATNLLSNNNRKVFFIIVDATKDQVKIEYNDAFANPRKKYLSQLTILNKFVSLFELAANQEIMKKVDAIHFVVTKADVLGCDRNEREMKARELLLNKYSAPVEQLKKYCRKTKRINYSKNYRPYVYAFSLGKFYLGDIFSFDKNDSLSIIDVIREVTAGEKEKTFWERIKKVFGETK